MLPELILRPLNASMVTYVFNELNVEAFQNDSPPACGTAQHNKMHEKGMLIAPQLPSSTHCLLSSVFRLFSDFVPSSILKINADDTCGMRDKAMMEKDKNL